jgi:hypothetical protein
MRPLLSQIYSVLSSLYATLIACVWMITTLTWIACTPIPSGPPSSVQEEGFRPYPSPRAFDAPGLIYRVDSTGSVYKVATLDVLPSTGEEVLPHISSSLDLSFQQFLETLGLPSSEVTAFAQLHKKQGFYVSSVNGIREYLTDQAVDQSLSKVVNDKKLTIRPTNKYYVVRETIATANISYKSNATSLIDFGLVETFIRIISAHASFRWNSEREFVLDQNFSHPLRVWYKPERIQFENIYGFGPNDELRFRLTSVPPNEGALPSAFLLDP